jgi:hypothetical protein
MSILSKHTPFVNEQIGFHTKQVTKYREDGRFPSAYRYSLHAATLSRFEELLKDLLQADTQLDSGASARQYSIQDLNSKMQFQLFPEDIEGLPQELIDQLSINDADKLEFEIINIIDEAGGFLNLDKILIGLFKKTNEVHKRTPLTAKLYRMCQKQLISAVPNKKGVYTTQETSNDESILTDE